MAIPDKATDWVSTRTAARILGVSVRTLRRYTARGRLPDNRSPANQRIFQMQDLYHLYGREMPTTSQVVLYARVSAKRNRDGLQNQLEILRCAAGERPVVKEYTDIASGLSDKRPGLNRALKECITNPAIGAILVTHRDRLARYGTRSLETMLELHNVHLEILDVTAPGSEQELVNDMLAIITSFSGKLYGQRSAQQAAMRKCVRECSHG